MKKINSNYKDDRCELIGEIFRVSFQCAFLAEGLPHSPIVWSYYNLSQGFLILSYKRSVLNLKLDKHSKLIFPLTNYSFWIFQLLYKIETIELPKSFIDLQLINQLSILVQHLLHILHLIEQARFLTCLFFF